MKGGFELIDASQINTIYYKIFYSHQSGHPSREETSFNNPSEGSEDQEEAHDSADQGGEHLFLLILHLFIIHPQIIGGKGIS